MHKNCTAALHEPHCEATSPLQQQKLHRNYRENWTKITQWHLWQAISISAFCFSLRLGHPRAPTVRRTVVHYHRTASQLDFAYATLGMTRAGFSFTRKYVFNQVSNCQEKLWNKVCFYGRFVFMFNFFPKRLIFYGLYGIITSSHS